MFRTVRGGWPVEIRVSSQRLDSRTIDPGRSNRRRKNFHVPRRQRTSGERLMMGRPEKNDTPNTFPIDASAGFDLWGPSEIGLCSNKDLDQIGELLSRYANSLGPPRQVLCNLINLLGEATGGHMCIGIIPPSTGCTPSCNRRWRKYGTNMTPTRMTRLTVARHVSEERCRD